VCLEASSDEGTEGEFTFSSEIEEEPQLGLIGSSLSP
jgi:hypothetical protein